MKNKRPLTPDQFKELITYADGGHEPRSWKDYGFNEHMEKPPKVDEQQAKRQRDFEGDLRKQKKHELEMQLLRKQTQSSTQDQPWCRYDYESKTFQITQNNGQLLALTFRPFKGKVNDQTILFEVGYELWKNGVIQIPRMEILNRCIAKANQYSRRDADINSYWIKKTRRNLRATIQESQLDGLIEVFEIVKSRTDIYSFSIKQPQKP